MTKQMHAVPEKENFRVLCLFDYACTTGFATVSHNIIDELKRHFGTRIYLDIIAINYFGEHKSPDERTNVYSAIKLDQGEDQFGRNAFSTMAAHVDYDIIFCIQDIIFHSVVGKILKDVKKSKIKNNKPFAKTIVYFPVDGNIIKKNFLDLDIFDTLVTYTQYGKKKIEEVKPEWKPRVKAIPHGINTDVFYHIEDRISVKKFRHDYFGANADKLIIMQVNRNQPRKDIPNSIFAYEYYKKNFNKNSFYYMHMNPEEVEGWQLKKILDQTSLIEGEDYMFMPEEMRQNGASLQVMNLLYNASDIFMTTTLAEGWGLSVAEAMSCQLPVVAPLHTSIKEITQNGQLIWGCEEFLPVSTHADSIIRDRVHHEEVAEKINECVESKFNKLKVLNAYLYIRKITWKDVCKRWIEEFENFV